MNRHTSGDREDDQLKTEERDKEIADYQHVNHRYHSHYFPQSSSQEKKEQKPTSSHSPDDLLQMFEDIEKMNDGRHLDCASMEKQDTERQQILQKSERRSDLELHGRQISLVELPALIRLSEEEVMRQILHCVSLCHPGVHAFLIIPDAPLNNEDKAEMEEIQRIFSSRINKHIMILIKQDLEHQTAELNEETQFVIERFGGRHHFFGPNSQVSTLMENRANAGGKQRSVFLHRDISAGTDEKTAAI
ncbi:hypothetical protein QQF64_025941 [Cirrhinus molitorella]|uniref:AIG1-type G domain-containing protein n=1 Tax=Cirrhinus molitorella TaxID=172907 RepID=A0ABR3NQG7_9TELE